MATARPRWANSSAVARPRPVAPPVTTTTRPWIVSARRCCWDCGSVAGVARRVASRAAVSQGVVGVKLSNLCSKLNIGKARRNLGAMNRLLSVLVWGGISAGGAAAFGVLALSRGESVNAAWLLTAALCSYAVGYRFYSRFLADRVFGLDDRRATPAEARGTAQHGPPPPRASPQRRQSPQGSALGHAHARLHGADRGAHGVVDEAVAAGQRGRGIGRRGRAAPGRTGRRGVGGGPAAA